MFLVLPALAKFLVAFDRSLAEAEYGGGHLRALGHRVDAGLDHPPVCVGLVAGFGQREQAPIEDRYLIGRC